MRTVDLTQPILLDDGEYTFVEQRHPIVKLRSNSTGETVDMHVAELSQRIVGIEPNVFATARVIEALSDKQADRTLSLADHLREIVTGEHPRLKAPRPQFDPTTTTQEQRVHAKLAELEATDLRMSRSTLMAKLSIFKRGGETALVDGRALRGRRVVASDRAAVTTAICDVIAAQRDESTGDVRRLIHLVEKELLLQFGAEAPPMPSERTMYRLIAKYSAGKHTTGSARTRRSLGNRPDGPFGRNVQLLPGAEMQLDSTQLDVFVKVPGQDPARPTLTIMIDAASRSIVAFTLRLVAAKSVDHIGLIAQALTPAQNQPDRTKFRQMVQAQNPTIQLLPEEEVQRLDARRPFIYPRTLVIDNGKDFKSTPTLRAAEYFQMNVVFSPPRTPTTKSIVERTLGTINRSFGQYLPGYIGGSVENRGLKVEERDDLLDLFAVQELFRDWVVNVWQNRPHESLRDPLHPQVRFSPNQVAATAAETVGTLHIPLVSNDYLTLLPSETRVLTSTGIRMHNQFYDAPELHRLRSARTTVAVHYDPYNPSMVWVKSPDDDGFIPCPVRTWKALDNPFFGQFTTDTDAADKALQRYEHAYISSQLEGTPIHQPLAIPALPDLHTSITTETDDDLELFEFDPEGEM